MQHRWCWEFPDTAYAQYSDRAKAGLFYPLTGLAQSLYLTTLISLTAGVAFLLIGLTCFSFYGVDARATRHPSVVCACGFTRNWMILWIPILEVLRCIRSLLLSWL